MHISIQIEIFTPVSTIDFERSQNTVLLASTQAVYKAPHSTVRRAERQKQPDSQAVSQSSSSVVVGVSEHKVRAHSTLASVVKSCTYVSGINASKCIQCIRCVQT